MEGKKTRRFRSGLELMALIQEALDASGGLDATDKPRTWQTEEELPSGGNSMNSAETASCEW